MHTACFPRLFVCSTGALLLAAALAMFLSALAGTGLIHPHEPLFGMRLPEFFCIVGGLALTVGMVCLFGENTILQTVLILWLAMNFAAYQAGLRWVGETAGFKGYLGDVSAAFGISDGAADLILKTFYSYLLGGGFFALLCFWKDKPFVENQDKTEKNLEVVCPFCNRYIKIVKDHLGRKIPCPHCKINITIKNLL